MKKNRYFSHDSNAHSDIKIIYMMNDYGIKGYGMYWITVEVLREDSNLKLENSYMTHLALSKKMGETLETVEKWLQDCIEKYNLFIEQDGYFLSTSLIDRLSISSEKSEKMRELANRRWRKVSSQDEKNKQSKAHNQKKDYTKEIEEIWSLYPRKSGKAQAMKKIPKLIEKHGLEAIINCVERYKKEIQIRCIEEQFIKMGSTFFNNAYVDYLDENYIALEDNKKRKVAKIDEKTGEVIY